MFFTPKESLLNSFLMVYFYTIENILNHSPNRLSDLKFQSEEANTDEHLKIYFQDFLSTHSDIQANKLKHLIIKIDSEEHFIDIDSLKQYKITDVLLPEQLTLEQKKQISESKKSVYTNPDLYLKITDGINIYFESVELKSTKDDTIPGSSIQQVSPYKWVIFIKRAKEKVTVATGFYINAINEQLPFPDRSPRPQVGFKTLLAWNKEYRKVENNTLIIESITDINKDKIKLLTDWQDYLASEWLEIILSVDKKKNEKWFNNAIRKLALKLLEHNDKMTENEKETLRYNLFKLIE